MFNKVIQIIYRSNSLYTLRAMTGLLKYLFTNINCTFPPFSYYYNSMSNMLILDENKITFCFSDEVETKSLINNEKDDNALFLQCLQNMEEVLRKINPDINIEVEVSENRTITLNLLNIDSKDAFLGLLALKNLISTPEELLNYLNGVFDGTSFTTSFTSCTSLNSIAFPKYLFTIAKGGSI